MGSSRDAVLEPVGALLVVALLALVMRWAFRSSAPRAGLPRLTGDRGLLRPAATVDGDGEAERLRAALAAAGIRSTVGAREDGRTDVLVFPADLDRAREITRWRG